jgi:dsRNA-specific ribonuclease
LGKIHNKRQGNQKMFFFKQLADVVESVTGAATVACGLNLTQNYLKSIGVLNVSQDVLADKLADLKSKKEDHPEGIAFVHAKYNENNNKMAEVERTINYVFKNKVWLVEALTHKSYMDSNKQNTTVYENLTVNESIDQVKLGFNEKLKEVK